MRNDLRQLARLHAVVESTVHMVLHLKRMTAADECGDGDDAAISLRQRGGNGVFRRRWRSDDEILARLRIELHRTKPLNRTFG